MLRDRYWNMLAINETARMLFGYDDADHNCLFTFFTNARHRAVQLHWASVAPVVVAAYRADAARSPGDPEFERVVADLGAVSPEFAELWARHDVAVPTQTVKAVHHPEAGDLIFDMMPLAVADHPDWHVELYNSRPGTDTEARLDQLTLTRLPAIV
ncbi:hypothetical protein ACLMAJ_18030 [Nocardia sp. KC 131]|uniref:MmyB family transcriptional regulator n=1 Tax=Nocardia arseniciresistens TaxID=3392119 RepID=UPI00398EC36A